MAGTRRMLTAADRGEISTGLKAGWSATRIAKSIGRATSVVTREIARNSTKTRGYRMATCGRRRPEASVPAAARQGRDGRSPQGAGVGGPEAVTHSAADRGTVDA